MQVEFHSIITGLHQEGAIANHRHYCERLGYPHVVHRMTSPTNRHTDILLYRYSTIRRALWTAMKREPGRLVSFADESAAICELLPAPPIIGDAPYWIANCSFAPVPDGCLIMLKANEAGLRTVDGILERLSTMLVSGADRWEQFELRHLEAHPADGLLEGRHRPLINFVAHANNLPDVSTFVLSFNERNRRYRHDARLADVFTRYLTSVQRRNGRLYDDLSETPRGAAPFEVINPGRPVAVLTAYTPNIAIYARQSARNVSAWCLRHNYTHYIYHDLSSSALLEAGVEANWAKADLLLRHLGDHEHLAWIDADILILRPALDLMAVVEPDADATFYRDTGGAPGFNNGFMVFANRPTAAAYLERVRADMREVPDRSSVYASGGDQHFFVQTWQRGHYPDIALLDSVTANSHPILLDEDTWMLHYSGIPTNIRAVFMRHDADTLVR